MGKRTVRCPRNYYGLRKIFCEMFTKIFPVFRKETTENWITIGVLYYKASHISKNSGTGFSVLKLTDLRKAVKKYAVFCKQCR